MALLDLLLTLASFLSLRTAGTLRYNAWRLTLHSTVCRTPGISAPSSLPHALPLSSVHPRGSECACPRVACAGQLGRSAAGAVAAAARELRPVELASHYEARLEALQARAC